MAVQELPPLTDIGQCFLILDWRDQTLGAIDGAMNRAPIGSLRRPLGHV